ncbi:hypothetical protein [Adhaeretor mobilis]|uniref:DNA methylase n=1 Tax=Adhaeretor mobilis TaxID=1930276 RepID=A0A517MS19_9BACT|nr:hypothetical protein [Adhaeretor mobilis]QDS97682.1 DNA methylase [Adhaeretor mobilis]
MARIKKKTKAQLLQEAIAESVRAGEAVQLDTVDFSDPDRPSTCLEVDFPILPVNRVAAIEGNAGKPVYQMSKWWARRRSSVFRALLLAAATRAPDDPLEAANKIWEAYYGNHQSNERFRQLTVADVFMGGGTTIVEGARLGMRMLGNDLNPVAWLIVKNELSQVASEDVQTLLDDIRAEVRPQLIPFYACDCPRGHKGQWTHSDGEIMPPSFDPLSVPPEDRSQYDYNGPEIIYTFWCKHGPCTATECDHRTPIMTSPVIAVKEISAKAWAQWSCSECQQLFDIEQKQVRMAPASPLIVAEDEAPFATMDEMGNYTCPHCGVAFQDEAAAATGESITLKKAKNKKVSLTLLVHPSWLRGASAQDAVGPYGGRAIDGAEATSRWNHARSKTLSFIEVRGKLPDEITTPDTNETVATGKKGGTIPGKSAFTCQEATCGLDQDILTAIRQTETTGPLAAYAVQGYCSACNEDKQPYGGRFFAEPKADTINAAFAEWQSRGKEELDAWWPKTELPFGFMTHQNNGGIPNHGFTHWWTMFNPRQLLAQSQLLRAITTVGEHDWTVREFLLGGFQQTLRNNNLFCIWNPQRDTPEPMFSNSNYHPKATMVENCVFANLGRGNWQSSSENTLEGLGWCDDPWELVSKAGLATTAPEIAESIGGKSAKTFPNDPVTEGHVLSCRSSSDLNEQGDETVDLVITDPPFGGLLHYSELSDFFHVWLRIPLQERFPDYFSAEYTPKALEAVANRARNPEDPDGFYQQLLTECWRESARILKPSGILAFTFHHSEDEPWVAVLESLFNAGFYLEATYPIRSDETKGEGGKPGTFGSQLIEYDIIHVCRKRTEEPEPISWARLRRTIMRDVRELQDILEQHHGDGLGEADLLVIRRGKALEYFSRHYGKVYVERGREDEFSVRDALLGINQLLDDTDEDSGDTTPVTAELYTRQFLRLFTDKSELSRDQIQKFLRGTGVSRGWFIDRGWCYEEKKVLFLKPPLEWAREWKGKHRSNMSRDFDQAYFLIGASYEESGIRLSDTLQSGSFIPHPAISDLLDWFARHGYDQDVKDAASRARQIYRRWEAEHVAEVSSQKTLFDMDEE